MSVRGPGLWIVLAEICRFDMSRRGWVLLSRHVGGDARRLPEGTHLTARTVGCFTAAHARACVFDSDRDGGTGTPAAFHGGTRGASSCASCWASIILTLLS